MNTLTRSNAHCTTVYFVKQRQDLNPPCYTIKDGEQLCNVGAHDVFELFDADEFEAAMIHSCEPPSSMNEEDMTTKDDGIIKALENAIVFFETLCLMDDFEAHAMDDEPNAPGATQPTLKPSLPCLSLQTKPMNIPPMHWLLKIQ
jgi:hypothetical protein